MHKSVPMHYLYVYILYTRTNMHRNRRSMHDILTMLSIKFFGLQSIKMGPLRTSSKEEGLVQMRPTADGGELILLLSLFQYVLNTSFIHYIHTCINNYFQVCICVQVNEQIIMLIQRGVPSI